MAHSHLEDIHKAIEYFEQALFIAQEIGDKRGEARGHWNLSLVLDRIGQRPEAIAHAQESLKIYEQIEDPFAAEVQKQVEEWIGQQ